MRPANRVFSVVGDRYSAEWVASAFAKWGVEYKPSDRSRSEIYLEILARFTSGHVELLDNQRLVTQLAGLERRTSRGAKDSVDRGFGGHDDLSNAACGALVLAAREAGGIFGLLQLQAQGACLQALEYSSARWRRRSSSWVGVDAELLMRAWEEWRRQ